MNEYGKSITNGFQIISSESSWSCRIPEKLRVDRGSEFYNKIYIPSLKEYETEF